MATHKDWLDGLKVGDRVIVSIDGNNHLEVIEELTATQIVVMGQTVCFHRKDGDGIRHYGYALLEPTEHRLLTIRRDKLLSRLNHEVNWGNWSTSILERVAFLVGIGGE